MDMSVGQFHLFTILDSAVVCKAIHKYCEQDCLRRCDVGLLQVNTFYLGLSLIHKISPNPPYAGQRKTGLPSLQTKKNPQLWTLLIKAQFSTCHRAKNATTQHQWPVAQFSRLAVAHLPYLLILSCAWKVS